MLGVASHASPSVDRPQTDEYSEVLRSGGWEQGGHLCVVGLAEFSLLFAGQIAFDEKTKIRQGAAEGFGEKAAVLLVFVL